MNPFPMVLADLRAMRWTAPVVILLVGLAVAIGVGIGAQERAMRQASARAADDFALLIGAPGSQTQLVLTSVYLRIEAVPLVPGELLNKLAADKRVAGVAPIGFGDMVHGYPVVGTVPAFASRWGKVAPVEGRLFETENEAVVGADVRLPIGTEITPSHGIGARGAVGEDSEEEHAHKHQGVVYKVFGRLPRFGSPWDRAVLVPIETVWETHGLSNGHKQDNAPLGPPFDAKAIPGVPVILVKPKSVVDAYTLRADYRQGGTMALFPAEVLVSLYRLTGDVSAVLVLVSGLNNIVVFLAILLLAVTLTSLRRRRYALLRALGAPPSYVFLVIWIGITALIAAGCVAGLLFGWLATWIAADAVAHETGLRLAVSLGWPEIRFTLILLAAGTLLATLPGLSVFRAPVSATLRG